MYREIFSFTEDFVAHLDRNQETQKITYQMLDCTFGGGGHSIGLLKRLPNLRILGLDLDTKVLNQCREHYSPYIQSKRLALEHSNYVNAQHVDVK
jgi:16S rRNA (cytosine1402-N4)-methyltransferase